MSNTPMVTGSPTPPHFGGNGFDVNVTTMSADTLLEYCRMQLGGLDSQITDQMNNQKTALRQREAVQSAQTALQKFGTDGPTSAPDMQKCVDAIDSAIAQLGPSDPTASRLADFRKQMCDQYKFTPARSLTTAEQFELNFDEKALTQKAHSANPQLQPAIDALHKIETGSLDKRPNKDAKEWQVTVDGLGTIATDIKSNADIEMLQLQDLVSQRQQAVQLASSMMSKEDQTLETLAKAIGQ